MNPLALLYQLLIGPLELFFEVVFTVAYRFVGHPGLSIVFLSLAMNFLVLPLYRRADAMQEDERVRAERMKPVQDHIRKTFKGDERFMMMQTYNRQVGYKPTDALKGSVSLLLEIPFFIAAYHFLSHLAVLRGVPFGPLADLGAPDALMSVGGLPVNVLPILMTAINLASAALYMKGMPMRNKVQMIGIALIFLVLLYASPSGLVFYWTLNNVFSLLKNVFNKLQRPGLVLSILASAAGVALIAAGVFSPLPTVKKEAFVLVAGLALQLPLATQFMRGRRRGRSVQTEVERPVDGRAFLLCSMFLALLTGVLIPLSIIHASPTEFANLVNYQSPLWYVAYSLALSVGTFVIWFGVFYWLASPRGKSAFGCAMFAFAGIAVVDYLFFGGGGVGNLSAELQYENAPDSTFADAALNLAVVVGASAALALVWLRGRKAAGVACACMCIAAIAMSMVDAWGIVEELKPLESNLRSGDSGTPHAAISRDGTNVVVIMMDRAISYYLPYLIEEKPELRDALQGFTYYPNATSYGIFTNVGTPGLYGGYDYVPEKMNERDSESLEEKQNEALKVMPAIFSQNGYDTTVFDPTYAGYSVVPDLSVFDDLPGVETYITMDGSYNADAVLEGSSQGGLTASNKRNFFCYSLFRASPVLIQPVVYHKGDYNSAAALTEVSPEMYEMQERDGASRSSGLDKSFMNSYSVLQSLPSIATVEEGDANTFLMMSNDTTHSPAVLAEPEYAPALQVDNTEFDAAHLYRYAGDGSFLSFPPESGDKEGSPLMHYEINMAALRELCEWFDYLRENGAFDNTRIIVVSDHGRGLRHFEDLLYSVSEGSEERQLDLMMASCLLLVKDFDSHEFEVNEGFMTNADVPAMALDGLVDDPMNPYTGNPIDSRAKEGEQHLLFSYDWNTAENNGNTFLPGYWFSVHEDIRDPENWEYLGLR